MVKDLKYDFNGRLESFIYTSEEIELQVNVNSFEVVRKLKSEDKTIGKVIENYREKRKENTTEAESYIDSKKGIIDNFFDKLNDDLKSYDYVQVMLPVDDRRKSILNQLAAKISDGKNHFSNCFKKITDKSIVGSSYDEAKENFTYSKPKIEVIPKTIFIVDDTIDTGKTISIFLDNLKGSGLLTTDSKVTASIIYNNFRDNFPKMSFDEIRSRLGKG